jgi:5'-nucleotidase
LTISAPSIKLAAEPCSLESLTARVAAVTDFLGRAPIAFVDMDGVVYEWGAQLNRVLKSIDPDFPIVPDHLRNHFGHLAAPGAEQRVVDWALMHPDLYTDGEATSGSEAALEVMRAIGLDVFLCTTPAWKNPFGYSGKVRFAADNFGEWTGTRTIFTHDKTLVFGDVIVDDKPRITGLVTPHWDHIVFDRSYNQDYDTGYRIFDWFGLDWAETIVSVLEERVDR